MNSNIDVSIMKTLFRELWLQSNLCTEPIEHIWFSLNEVAKSTSNSSKEINKYLNHLIEMGIVEKISDVPLLHQFTELGKRIKTESEVEKTIKKLDKH